MGRAVGFVVMIALVTFGVHYYLWRRLVRDTLRPGRGRRVATVALVLLGSLIPITQFLARAIGPEASRWVAWPGYLWLAMMFYLFVILLVLEIPRAIAVRLARRGGDAAGKAGEPASEVAARDLVTASAVAGDAAGAEAVPAGVATDPQQPGKGEDGAGVSLSAPDHPEAGMDRRMFVTRTVAAVAGVAAVGTVGFGMRTALGDPLIKRVPVTLARLDPRMSGLRIAVVSDIHLGPLLGRAHTERIVRKINELEADVVAVVGDLVDGSVRELGAAARPLRDLESRYGSFFVTGNHEYFSGADEWVEEVRRLGLKPLRNERVEIAHAGAVLDLAGVDDVTGTGFGRGPDFGKTLGGRDSERAVVLLAHQPVQAREAARHGVDLQLSGHTHGGQMVPFNLVVPVQQPVVSGLGEVDGTQVYVTNGAGFWGPPVRVGAPPDISLVELRSKR
ncbi:metallophosphoesterase [Bailinhaonella thermotolerans]|uniref:Metallophosphoesterase n=1 Tax=Bailinhaonella thermotolerans TaxID=1070861 RepID=A0A3A4AWY3_9ACTN|nr:metallophosphoesterase [Bailinhaonella thermotolerans]RJL31884.1 metallophosphoesterase [Bailinhaonella thermotolerans]